MASTTGVSLALVALLGSSACAGAALGDPVSATDADDAPVPAVGLFPGETMAFEVSLAGMLVGEASLAVGEVGTADGRPALMVRSRIATAGAVALIKHVEDEATTTIDAATGLPLSYESDVVTGDREYTASARFVGNKVSVIYQRKGESPKPPLAIDFKDNPALDAHAAMAMTRTWRGEVGDVRTLWIIGGRRVWRTDLTLRGAETLGTRDGNHRALRLDGIARRARNNLAIDDKKPPRTFTVWVSDDADRVPLRVKAETELGDVTIELVEYTPGHEL